MKEKRTSPPMIFILTGILLAGAVAFLGVTAMRQMQDARAAYEENYQTSQDLRSRIVEDLNHRKDNREAIETAVLKKELGQYNIQPAEAYADSPESAPVDNSQEYQEYQEYQTYQEYQEYQGMTPEELENYINQEFREDTYE